MAIKDTSTSGGLAQVDNTTIRYNVNVQLEVFGLPDDIVTESKILDDSVTERKLGVALRDKINLTFILALAGV